MSGSRLVHVASAFVKSAPKMNLRLASPITNFAVRSSQQPLQAIFNGSRFFSTETQANSSNNNSDNSKNNDSNNNNNNNEAEGASKPTKTPEQEQIEKLTAENKTLKDQLLRALAEEENVRRIARRDVDNAKQFSISSFAKTLLEIADNLEMAIESYPKEKRSEADKSVNTLLEGVEMTNKNLQKVFNKAGIVKYGVIGDKFDPTLHNALFNIPDANKEANTIGQVLKTGYKLNERVIRAADVGTFQQP